MDQSPAPTKRAPATPRNYSVDVIRVLAIMAVIVIHIKPFTHVRIQSGMDFSIGNFLNQACRFAVPFFFVISGFFWSSKFTKPDELRAPTLHTAKRLALLFIAWSIFYLFMPTNPVQPLSDGPLKIAYMNLLTTIAHPGTFLQQGTEMHLWFLVALLCSLAISALLLAYDMPRTLFGLALLLYLIGLSGKAYADTPVGFHTQFNLRNGPFFALIFFVSGYLLQRLGPKPSWFYYGMALTVLGSVMHFSEIFLIKHYWGTTALPDYLLGTYFAGIGVAMIALSNPPVLQIPQLSVVARLVLGIYAVHFAFIDLLRPLDNMFSTQLWWGFVYPVSVFLLSFMVAFALSRSRFTKDLVM